MQLQGTASTLTFASIPHLFLKECYSNVCAVHMIVTIFFNTNFVSQTNRFDLY